MAAKSNNKKLSEENNIDNDSDIDIESDQEEEEIVLTKFDKVLQEIKENNDTILKLQRDNKKLYKRLTTLHSSEIKKAENKKRKSNSKPTGFAKTKEVGGKFADWLGVERGSELTGPEISGKFWTKMKELNLQYEDDGRILRTNAEVSKLFGLKKSVNRSIDYRDKKGFNMTNYQSKIKYALANHNN